MKKARWIDQRAFFMLEVDPTSPARVDDHLDGRAEVRRSRLVRSVVRSTRLGWWAVCSERGNG